MLAIDLLGSPQILYDGRPVQVARRKSRALVYYLATAPQPLTRDHLQGIFWPDHERAAAQQVLRTTLHGLRSALGGAIQAADDTLSLTPDVQVDVRFFESVLASPPADAAALQQVLALYRGDFLGDFYLPDAAEFDNWAAAERERYRRMAMRGQAALSRLLAAAGDYAPALAALDRALECDPFQEDLQREGLRLHYLLGDRAGAIRRYDHLRKMLDEEMGVPPMAETRTLYDAILNDRLPVERPPAATGGAAPLRPLLVPGRPEAVSTPFTGRNAELETLRSLQGSGRLALIEGEPGIGKTRLAMEYLRTAQAAALLLPLAGAGRELEQFIPYHPISEALRGLLNRPDWPAIKSGLSLPSVWLGETARLLPELAASGQSSPPGAQPADELRLWEGVTQFLFALGRQQQFILFLDDLQWADQSTIALLSYLSRRAAAETGSRSARISLLAAARTSPLRPALASLVQALTREELLTRVPLARLNEVDTAALARRISPDYAHPLTVWLTRNAEGNPYIMAELLRYAYEKRLLEADGRLHVEALGEAPTLPPSVYSLIKSRLDALSEPARRVLGAAVACGREFDFEVVARASALSEDAAVDALDELRANGLVYPLDSVGLRYTFDHALTMEVAFKEEGETRHRLLHRHVAEAIESIYRGRLDDVAGLLAWHYNEANAPARGAAYALRAARHASGLAAWSEAAGYYRQALEGLDDASRAEAYMALGDVQSAAGESAAASEAYYSALSLAQSRGDRRLVERARLAIARSLLPQARYAEAIDIVQQVCASAHPEFQADAEFIWGTALSLEGSDLEGASAHLAKAEATLLENRAGDTPERIPTLAQVKFEQGSVLAQQGDLEKAIALYKEALAVAERSDAAILQRILAHNNIAYHQLLLGDPQAPGHAQIGLQLAREKGALFQETYLLSTSGEIALANGDVDGAEKYFREGLELARRLNTPERIAGFTANLGLVARQRGQTGLAIHHLSAALAKAEAASAHHLAAQIRLWLAPLLPPAEARATLKDARKFAAGSGRKRLLAESERLERELAEK